MHTLWRVLPGLSFLLLLGSVAPGEVEISFQQRVDAQRAIERVYYSHHIGAVAPFEAAVSREVIERKVITYLRQSMALDRFWHQPVTREALRAEVNRIARSTRMPSRLAELYAALGDDPLLIQECLARPALVDRLARGLFSADRTIHADARRQAEALREQLASGALSLQDEDQHRSIIDVRLGEETDGSDLALLPESFARLRGRAPRTVGAIGPVEEEHDAFVIHAVLDEDNERFRLASYTVPKRTWQEWWAGVEAELDEMSVRVVASSDDPLPAPDDDPVAIPQTITSAAPKPMDFWSNGSLDDLQPAPRKWHTAVWMGTEMIVWGGRSLGTLGGPGERYDPTIDTFTQISTQGRTGDTLLSLRSLDGHEDDCMGGGLKHDEHLVEHRRSLRSPD